VKSFLKPKQLNKAMKNVQDEVLFFVKITPCNKSELDGLTDRFVYVPGIKPGDEGHYIAVFNDRREYAQCVLEFLEYSKVTYGQLAVEVQK